MKFGLALALAAVGLFALGSQQVDPDLFWHLRVAELVQVNGPQPILDTFSYNSTPTPWIPYSWLAELGMRWAVEGLGGLALFTVQMATLLLVLAFIALMAVEHAGRTLKAAVVSLLVVQLLIPFLAVRPVALTFPLCAYAAWAVTRPAPDRSRWLVLATLVPLTALLANLHLFFLYPPLLLGVWGVGEWLERRARDPAAWRVPLAYLSLAGLAVAVALAANPFQLGLVEVIGHYLFHDVMVRTASIEEMRPFFKLTPSVIVGTTGLVVWCGLGLWRRRRGAHHRLDRRHLLLFALALALIVLRGRYLPLASFILTPLAASTAPWPRLDARGTRRMHAVALGALIALVLNATYIQVTDPPEREFEEYLAARTGYPVAAAQFVRDSLPRGTGRLINDFDWGGYLIYALWPEYQVMLDGRTQVYPERLWRAAYVDATRESLRGLFRAAEADAALLPRGAGWGEILGADLGWEVVYSDSLAAVWRPPGSGRPPR